MLLSMLGVNLSAGHDGVVSVHVLRLKPWIDGKIHWTVMMLFLLTSLGGPKLLIKHQNYWSCFVISTCGCIIPSLKLTVRTWKRMVGRRLCLFGSAQPGRCELLVSGSVYIFYYFLDLVVPPLCSFPGTLIIDDFLPAASGQGMIFQALKCSCYDKRERCWNKCIDRNVPV